MKRWGILGTSFISGIMADAINNNPDSTLQAIAGRRKGASDAIAKKYSISKSYNSYEQLINDIDVDIVYIALPNHIHHEYVQKALFANKHVLCEKSLSSDMEKAALMANTVKQSKQCFIEGLMYLAHPLTAKLIDVLMKNKIGKIKTITARYCVDIAKFVNQDGGGVIYNLGCYPISTVHSIMQKIYGATIANSAVLTADGKFDDNQGNIVDATINLTFSNGVTAIIHSAETFNADAEFTIEGEHGVISLLSNLWLPKSDVNQLSVSDHKGNCEIITVNSCGDAFFYQTQQFINMISVQEKKTSTVYVPPYPSIDDSLNIMKLLTQWQNLITKSVT